MSSCQIHKGRENHSLQSTVVRHSESQRTVNNFLLWNLCQHKNVPLLQLMLCTTKRNLTSLPIEQDILVPCALLYIQTIQVQLLWNDKIIWLGGHYCNRTFLQPIAITSRLNPHTDQTIHWGTNAKSTHLLVKKNNWQAKNWFKHWQVV